MTEQSPTPTSLQNIKDFIFNESVRNTGILKGESVISYNHETDCVVIKQELNRPFDIEVLSLLITLKMIEKFKFLISFRWTDSLVVFTIRNIDSLLSKTIPYEN